jgi:hypothetical protein
VSTSFLFGAGASYGSGPCYPSSPPLGKDLFDELVSQGGLVTNFPADLAATFREDFEAGMDRVWHERNGDLTKMQCDLAEYLVQFSPLEGNFYSKLMQIMGKNRKYVMATTNYDLLIELAAMMNDMKLTYRALPIPENNLSILKIHGSCNFLPDPDFEIRGGTFILTNKASAIMDVPLRISGSVEEIRWFCKDDNAMAPAIAIYSPEKQVLHSPEYVKQQQREWQRSLREASRIYVIGMRVHLVDEHIWGELAKVKVPVYYVGRQEEAFYNWAKDVGLKHAKVVASSFEEALPHIEATHRRPGQRIRPKEKK